MGVTLRIMQKMNTFVKSFLCVTLVHNVCATPVKSTTENIEEVEVVVGVEDSKLVEVNPRTPTKTNIAGSLVTDVKQINLFLNIPTGKAVIGVILDFRKAASSEWTLRSIRTSVRKQECSFQLLEKHLGIQNQHVMEPTARSHQILYLAPNPQLMVQQMSLFQKRKSLRMVI